MGQTVPAALIAHDLAGRMMKTSLLLLQLLILAIASPTSLAFADGLTTCDMAAYTASPGLTARVDARTHALDVAWTGQSRDELRAQFAIDRGQPLLRELAIRAAGGEVRQLRALGEDGGVHVGVEEEADGRRAEAGGGVSARPDS